MRVLVLNLLMTCDDEKGIVGDLDALLIERDEVIRGSPMESWRGLDTNQEFRILSSFDRREGLATFAA